MFLKSSLLMTSGLGFDTYVREEVREERVQVKKPHVILIMTDQHRGDALGCMGNSAVISPNLDRLAKEGTFDWHVALASWHAGVWSSCRKVYVRDAANVT